MTFADRAAFLTALHQRFHETVFAQVISGSAEEKPGPERARRRILAFLDIAARESVQGRRLPAAHQALLQLIPVSP